jgi:hypothetical protein
MSCANSRQTSSFRTPASRSRANRARGDRAELQVLREAARSVEIEAVAILGVAIVRKDSEPGMRGALTRFDQARVANDAEDLARRDRDLARRRRHGPRVGGGIGDPIRCARDERVPERREHLVGAARRGADRSRRHESLALEEIERTSFRHAAIALASERLRPAMRDDAIDRQLARDARHDVDALAFDDDEA